MNKRGQFYLIAAVVVLVIFGGFILISNKVSYVQNPHIYSVKNEIRTEASAIIDYGTNNAETSSQIEDKLVNLSEYYINETPESNLYFLLGTVSGMIFIAYQTNQENVYLDGSQVTGISPKSTYRQDSISPTGNSIDIKVNETDYNFTIKEGENFYFVISSLAGGQNYVISS